ncbi:hypothetical protein ACFL52_01015 [Candidatus Margulisiibacteriota bacterium]
MKKSKKKNKESHIYSCSACGSSSFIQEGTANFKEKVSISIGKSGMVVEGGDPVLDNVDSTIKCAKCGVEAV